MCFHAFISMASQIVIQSVSFQRCVLKNMLFKAVLLNKAVIFRLARIERCKHEQQKSSQPKNVSYNIAVAVLFKAAFR